MKLIDYVLQHESVLTLAEIYGYESEKDYIMSECCPSKFKCIEDTMFDKPFKRDVSDKSYCKYNLEENNDKCNECWNRNILK